MPPLGPPTSRRCSGPTATSRCGTAGTPARRRVRPARGAHRAPAGPLRVAHPRAARRWSPSAPSWPGRCRAPTTTCAVEARLRRLARGRAARRRRAGPAHADLDRELGPRPGRGRAGGAADGRGARAGTRTRSSARSSSTTRACAAERDSQSQADDQAADAVRLMAPDMLAGVQGDGSAPRAS